ncbi:MAG: hypothetical protein HND58_02145 [Planctomycetota bacterium]|nr:MAG: hypothetical protein HND58_02145 [Planctomycetota bacterium]
MRFETSQNMRLGQSMKLAPRVIQSMEILQMSVAELEERLEQELASNPTIELTEIAPDPDALPERREQGGSENAEDFSRLEEYETANPDAAENTSESAGLVDKRDRYDYDEPRTRSTRLDGERDSKMDAMAAAPARDASLGEQLKDQWSLAEVDETLRPAGSLIVSFLDEDGYLRTPFETLIDRAPTDADGHKPDLGTMERARSPRCSSSSTRPAWRLAMRGSACCCSSTRWRSTRSGSRTRTGARRCGWRGGWWTATSTI